MFISKKQVVANRPVEFKVDYEYTRYGVYFDMEHDKSGSAAAAAEGPVLDEFLREGPHVAFTPEMRELSTQIVGHETDPRKKAKLIYDWIAEHIKYSFAIEYSTIRDIGDYCRSKGYGDCGQEALLFITLCRLNGVPARWQSGWNTFPGFKDIHDWSEIYVAPYGWVPVDPYMGIFSMRYATSLSPEQRRELRDFYFGGMEQYRMAANSDHSQALTPPKQSMRSDDVDFQRGELEYGNHNIYFDKYSYELEVKEVEPKVSNVDRHGRAFVGFDDYSSFKKETLSNSEITLTSPVIDVGMPWDELVASWNADTPQDAFLKVEVRAIYDKGSTKFYNMGQWSGDRSRHPRESVVGQADKQGDVDADTLDLKQLASRLELRVTLAGDKAKPKLSFLAISLLNRSVAHVAQPPFQAAWGKVIPVPERSQMAYPDGKAWCSPTTVSMLMSHWSHKLNRPEINFDVPQVAAAVFDPNWHGTGNWSFNMAFAGSCPGMRAYAARLSNISEVEQWIAAGIPVGLSVSYNILHSIKNRRETGHLIVCVGFTATGDVVINDPGTSHNIRQTIPRKILESAWAHSHDTAYIIYPINSALPKDHMGHWDSWLTRQRM